MSEEVRMLFLSKFADEGKSHVNERQFNAILESGGWKLHSAQYVVQSGFPNGWQCLISREKPEAVVPSRSVTDENEGDPTFKISDMFAGTVPIPDDPEEEKD